MKRVFSDPEAAAAETLEEVERRMRGLGAVTRECRAMCRAVELFLEWCGKHRINADREAGIAWLRERQPGMAEEAFEEMKAGLATWMHMTGQAKSGKPSPAGSMAGAGPLGELPQGGRVSGVALTWQEAGACFKGFLACKSYSRNTVECYVGWARRFCRWCGRTGKEVAAVEAQDIRGFLEWLAGTQVGAKTQNQALNALVAFFRHGMGKEPGEIGEYLRARVSRRLPVVLNRQEAAAVMQDLEARGRPMWLMAGLMLGAGLRQKEVLELRIKDLDLERGAITVRQGKGDKDRLTVLPERVKDGLKVHLGERRTEFQQDLERGAGYVPLPGGLARKKPAAARSWGWQYVFGGLNIIEERETGRMIRWHVHETTVGRLLGEAARRCGVVRQVTCHALRHTFATLALENGTDKCRCGASAPRALRAA